MAASWQWRVSSAGRRGRGTRAGLGGGLAGASCSRSAIPSRLGRELSVCRPPCRPRSRPGALPLCAPPAAAPRVCAPGCLGARLPHRQDRDCGPRAGPGQAKRGRGPQPRVHCLRPAGRGPGGGRCRSRHQLGGLGQRGDVAGGGRRLWPKARAQQHDRLHPRVPQGARGGRQDELPIADELAGVRRREGPALSAQLLGVCEHGTIACTWNKRRPV